MKPILTIAAALATVVIFSNQSVSAQTCLHPGGFPYLGINANGCGFAFQALDREQPPYFAKFPPVYYSHAVKRPYGVSPYAAPAGVVPVEVSHALPAVEPIVIENPHVKPDSGEAKSKKGKSNSRAKQKSAAKPKNRVAGWQMNPFMRNLAAK